MTDPRRTLKFLKNQKRVQRIIRNDISNKRQIVHGARALNSRFPHFLTKPTEDYDVFSAMPKSNAERMERKLDKFMRGNFFDVKKGTSAKVKTHKVVSNVTGRSVVDYTKPVRPTPNTIINGVRFTTLNYQEAQSKRTLNDPASEFRHDKERDVLQRIAAQKELQKQKGRFLPKLFDF